MSARRPPLTGAIHQVQIQCHSRHDRREHHILPGIVDFGQRPSGDVGRIRHSLLHRGVILLHALTAGRTRKIRRGARAAANSSARRIRSTGRTAPRLAAKRPWPRPKPWSQTTHRLCGRASRASRNILAGRHTADREIEALRGWFEDLWVLWIPRASLLPGKGRAPVVWLPRMFRLVTLGRLAKLQISLARRTGHRPSSTTGGGELCQRKKFALSGRRPGQNWMKCQ